MRIAIVDMGTNTFKLLIADVDHDDLHLVHQQKSGVQLGKGSYSSGYLSEAAMQRAAQCLLDFQQVARNYKANVMYAFATAAVRDAANGQAFVEQMRLQTAVDVSIISGEQEAKLITRGVMSALSQPPGHFVIMDIGGGSTEFIQVQQQKVQKSYSYPLGATRLMQKLAPSDPLAPNDIAAFNALLDEALQQISREVRQQPITLVGSSGSFETFADMIDMELNGKAKLEYQNSKTLSFGDMDALLSLLETSGRQERMKMRGLPEYRVDTIVQAALAVRWVRAHWNVQQIITSFRALKEGLFLEIAYNRFI